MMEEGEFITFVNEISMTGAEKMDEEKITPDLVNHMSDQELSLYLPRHGDRLRLRAHLSKASTPQKKKNKLLTVLQQKLDQAAGKKTTKTLKDSELEEMRNPHRPFGNRYAAKHIRQIELGWIHKTHKRSIQVRKKKGGGTRKTEVAKSAGKREIMHEAISLFFPNGESPKGPVSEFNFDLWDFSDRPIDEETTVFQMYEKTKMPILRFYLATSQKCSDPVTEPTEPSSPIPSDHNTSIDLTEELDVLHQDIDESAHNDLLSHAMELVDLPISDVDFLPDPSSPVTHQSTENTSDAKEISMKLHRGHLLKELIDEFKKINPLKDIVCIQMVMPDGSLEAAEDGGGVTRDTLSEFWMSFYNQCTLGTKFKVPFLRHDFAEKEWESVAKIVLFGWKSCGYFPIQLSLPFLQMCLYGKISVPILDAFFEVVPEDEALSFKKALSDFDSVEIDELTDILELHESKCIPTANNINKLLQEIAHKELIQTPMFIVDCFKPVLQQLHVTEQKLGQLYSDLIPTPKIVSKMFKFPEVMCPEEQTMSHHLRRFVRELNSEMLRKFIRFCTGSDLLVNKEIQVSFVNVSGLTRRPVAHTCSCLLELSKTYESYPQFRTEFRSVLESNIWVMEIV